MDVFNYDHDATYTSFVLFFFSVLSIGLLQLSNTFCWQKRDNLFVNIVSGFKTSTPIICPLTGVEIVAEMA
jgi:hypothetical protein